MTSFSPRTAPAVLAAIAALTVVASLASMSITLMLFDSASEPHVATTLAQASAPAAR